MDKWRSQVTAGLTGRVIEIGFGSGLNIKHYPPEVDAVLTVEPATTAKKLAHQRIAAASVPIVDVGENGQAIMLDDATCDSALTTFTLCTIRDVEQALREIRRVLRPGGSFHFLEHGLSPEQSVARWQRRLDPIQGRLADGCHLTREPLTLLADAGFVVKWSDQRYAKGPRPWSYFTIGVAINP